MLGGCGPPRLADVSPDVEFGMRTVLERVLTWDSALAQKFDQGSAPGATKDCSGSHCAGVVATVMRCKEKRKK